MHTFVAALFALLGAFVAVLAVGPFLGSRAPDVVYGDEMNFPEGVVFFLVALALYQGNRHVKIFAAIMAVVNGIAPMFEVWTLSKPFALFWVGIWACVFAAAFWLAPKAERLTSKEAVKTA
jgi:hypothetical protein